MLETISKSETSPEKAEEVEKDLEMLKASTSASQEEPSGEDWPVKAKPFVPRYQCYFEGSLHRRLSDFLFIKTVIESSAP